MQYSQFYQKPPNTIDPFYSAVYYPNNYLEMEGQPYMQPHSYGRQRQYSPGFRPNYSKQSLHPLLKRNDSYIDMKSMHSVPHQTHGEDYGNDEFYSNLEEEYLQKVIMKNHKKNQN